MPKKRTKKKSTKKSAAERLFEQQSENDRTSAPEVGNESKKPAGEQSQTADDDGEVVSPSFLERLEKTVRRANEVFFNQAVNLFFFSALLTLGLSLLQSEIPFLSGVPEILVIPAIGGLLATLGCAASLVVGVLFLYRDFQKTADDESRGFYRYILKAVLWTLPKRITLTLIGAVLISVVLTGQFEPAAIFQLTKQYNPWALALLAPALMLLCGYGIYVMYGFFYQIVFAPFDDLFVKYLGFSLSPHIPFKKMAGILIGGCTLCLILTLAASLIDPRIIGLLNDLTNQVVEANKAMVKNRQVK